MALLTWRDVAAPNFNGAVTGITQTNQLLSNALTGLANTIGGVRADQVSRADTALAQAASRYQDPEQLKAALADGSLVANSGANPNRVSAASLNGLQGRVGTLLDQATASQALSDTQYNSDRLRTQNTALDAARGAIAAYQAAQAGGRPDEAQGIYNQNKDLFASLSPDQLTNILKTGQNLSSGNLDYNISDFNFGKDKVSYADQQSAEAALNSIITNSADSRSALEAYGKATANLSPTAANAVRAQLDRVYPGLFGPVSGTAVGGAMGTTGGRSSLGSNSVSPAVTTMTGGAQLPAGIRTIGDIVDNKQALLGTNPKGTATGLYQMTSDTWADFAPKALGSDWRSADVRDPAVQDKVAKALWDQIKDQSPAAIHGRWASISESKAADLKGKDWSQVRDTISQGETRTRASEILAQALNDRFDSSGITDSIARRIDQAQSTNPAVKVAALAGDQTSKDQVLQGLMDGAFKGYNQGTVLGQLNSIMAKGGVNPAQAAQILIDAQDQKGVASRIGNALTNFLTRGVAGQTGIIDPASQSTTINQDRVDEALRNVSSPAVLQDARDYRTRVQALQQLQAVDQELQSAQSTYAQIQARSSALPNSQGLKDAAASARKRVIDAQLKRATLGQAIQANSALLQPNYQTPAALTPQQQADAMKTKAQEFEAANPNVPWWHGNPISNPNPLFGG